jgi:UDP-N-acetylmuramoylalanine--D-glutamate ligase
MSQFANKRAVVIGLDPSGQAACRLLHAMGADIVAVPSEHAVASVEEKKALLKLGIELGTSKDLRRKFDLVVLSSSVSRTAPMLKAFQKPQVPILSDLELASQRFCCLSIGIAGTNGKTTTAELVQQILISAHRKSLQAGGSGLPVCELAEKTRDLDFVTLDINSFQLESINDFRPAVAVLLNLKPDHMDRYDRMSSYAKTVARIFLKQQPFDWAIVQSEALAHLRSLNIEIPSKIITFSANNARADIYLDRGLIISRMEGWTGPLLDMDHVQLKGPHNGENIMAALAVGRVLRIPLEDMIGAVKKYKPGPHRFELVAEIEGVQFINNSKALNADAAAQSIQAVPPARGGEANIWLIAGGKDKGLEYHDLGPLLARRVKGAFLLGETREKLRAAWSLFTPCTLVETLLEAVSKAAESAAPGDVVLLSPSCSSFDMFQNYQHRGQVFREAVESLIQTTGGSRSEMTTIATRKATKISPGEANNLRTFFEDDRADLRKEINN